MSNRLHVAISRETISGGSLPPVGFTVEIPDALMHHFTDGRITSAKFVIEQKIPSSGFELPIKDFREGG